MPLGPRQQEVLEFIKKTNAETGLSPSYSEISAGTGASVQTVYHTITTLVSKGYIEHPPGRQRWLRVLPVPHSEEAAA